MRPTTAVRTVRHDPADRPLLVIWEATRACALSCVHCRAEAQPRRDPRELDTDEATELMRQVASFGRPSPIFVITGGDCFERPDLDELVRRGRDLGLAVAVSPSGTAKLDRAALVRLQEAGVTAMSLSLDGATAQVHDGFRRVPGTFERTVEAWAVARELGMKVQVNSTMSARTVHELPDLAALVRAQGAMTWSAFMLVPMGRGVDLGVLSAQQAEDVMNYLYDLGPYVPVKTTEGHHFRRVSLQRTVLAERGVDHVAALGLGDLYRELTERTAAFGWGEPVRTRRPPVNVNAGYGFVFVSHVGTVHPSGFLPVSAGDVRVTPLPEIYRTSELFTGLRDATRLQGRCGRCEFARVCGGSRSRGYAASGDPHGEDPLCGYEPGSFPYPQDVEALLTA
ncbi:TIGR04053 family radical SAM/SPASM domain-containing protein [Cellulomonas sp.]|uniref:TIGR04053 family radical SAM/SPASM domain-containing protein n=1 Tax=Cellulomonas sp. TaxID=40001 RepID=UPI0025829828|nr:TIGR04053 family radical SAM/SPASM domain-containing protein [Cellulomonas sp.]MCR6689417.1 TIGR04053 family radical SAM/SPASM domain-containing protein [Cellulomonas sp.]